MNKPISVLLEEAKTNVAQVINREINEEGLHPSLLLPIVKGLYEELIEVNAQITAQEKAEYEQALRNTNKSASDEVIGEAES